MDNASTRIDGPRVSAMIDRERRRFAKEHPRSVEAAARGRAHLIGAAALAPFLVTAKGARVRDLDGRDYLDFHLGNGAALTGHAAEPVATAVSKQIARGGAVGLPVEEAALVGQELAQRFGLPAWMLTVSADEALRAALRLARRLTGRPTVVLFEGHDYGGLSEIAGARVIAFNDLDALRAALAPGDVAGVLGEPAMTAPGLVPPASGYHAALQEAARAAGAFLILDETQTLASGVGGYTREHKLTPDLIALGPAAAGGFPAGALGVSRALADRLADAAPPPAGALTAAAMRAALGQVLTETVCRAMITRASALASGLHDPIRRHGLSWSVTKIGARCGLAFAPAPPRNGAEARAARHEGLETWLDLYFLNEGLLATAFPPRLTVSAATSEAEVARAAEVFARFVETGLTEGAISP